MSMCQEEEMRRLVAAQRDLHGDTSQSDWSEVSEDEEPRGAETDGGLDQLSMAANGGLTDAEGAMSGGQSTGCSLNIRTFAKFLLWKESTYQCFHN